jgi:uncharacterized membrane protein YdjX (TVP38/TMEM64 family)
MPRKRHSLLILFVIVWLTIFSLIIIRPHLHQIDQWLMSIGWWGPLFIVVLYTLLSVTPIPTDPITVLMGAFYGPLWGLVISWAGNTAAAMFEYFLAHHLGNLAQFDKLRHKLPWGLANARVDSIWFLTLGRMAPGFGSKVVSVLAGLYHVPKRRYLWTVALTNLAGSLLYVLGGHILSRW